MNLHGRIEEHLQEQARQAACQFLLAFSSGEYSNYQRFHFPVDAKLNQDFYEKFRASVAATNRQPVLSPSPRWAVDSNYLAANSNIWPPLLTPPPPFPVAALTPSNFCQLLIEQVSCGTYYKGYFAALSVTNSSISVEQVTALPQSLESFVTSTPNIGTVSFGKHFEFERSPAQVLEKHKVLSLVTCKLVVRLKPPDTVVPQFVRYYYDPDADALLPCEYVLANVMRASYVFPWF